VNIWKKAENPMKAEKARSWEVLENSGGLMYKGKEMVRIKAAYLTIMLEKDYISRTATYLKNDILNI
jgi:hypothetical protein